MIVVAAGVIERVVDGQQKILLTRRLPDAHLAGQWEFPGGKLEDNEDPRDAVVRECREECAIEIEALDVLDVVFHRFEAKSVLLIFYRCRWLAGEVQHLGVSEHAWILPSEAASYNLPPADAPIVERLLTLAT